MQKKAQHKPLVRSEFSKLGSKQQEWFSIWFCDKWAIVLLAKDLLHHFHTIICHNMDLKIGIQ